MAPDVSATRESADLDLLTGPGAEPLLAAVLAAEGVELTGWSTHQVQHRPGVGVSVGWSVSWRRAGGGAQGTDYLVATTAAVPPGPGATTATLDGRPVTVWRHPFDPALPGLATAVDPATVAGLLGEPVTGLELVTYRPLRRAVLKVTTDQRSVYLKVVRPHTVADLLGRHRLLRAAGVPAAPAWVLADGVLALAALPGRPLTDLLAEDGAAGLDPRRLLEPLAGAPRALLDLPRRPSWAERVTDQARAAAAALPDQADRVERLAAEVAHRLAVTDAGPLVVAHGDLHEANLLLDGGAVVGLLDVDGLGPGHRVDDVGCLLGHLSVLPALAPRVHRHVPGLLTAWTRALSEGLDPAAVRARAAGVALSLVAGARQVDRPWRADALGRLAAAEQWLDS